MKWLVAGLVIIVGGILWWAQPQRVIGVAPISMTVPRDTSKTFTAQLLYKSWFKRSFDPIRGTITSTAPPSIVVVTPPSIVTTRAGGRTATITVLGIASGSGKIIVNGTSRKGSHDTAKISVVVP